jgi:hypothetical protein
VRGRRDNPAHTRLPVPAEATGIAEVGLDYCFLRRADCEDKLTVLVQKDRDSRALRTQVVASKGTVCEEAVDAALRGIREFGHSGKVILKADGEASIRALKEELLRKMEEGGFSAQPVAYEHESNGSIENGVKAFKGLFRVHLLALDRKLGTQIPIDHPIVAWLVEFIGDILTKYLVGLDGKTGYERLFGKASREELLEFGEVVLWRRPRGQDTNVIVDARWETGIWVGRKWCTPHHLVSFGDRVIECRAVQRVPKADRWKIDMINTVRATRWANPAVADPAPLVVLPGPVESPPEPPDARPYVPRPVYIRMEDIRRFGRTAGCRRCTLMTNGEPARGIVHTRACRERIERAMIEAGDDGRLQAAVDRQLRYHLQEPAAEQLVQSAEEEGRRAEAAGSAGLDGATAGGAGLDGATRRAAVGI